MSKDYKHIALKSVVNVCRFLLGATFLFSGFVKAIDPFGFSYKLQDYFTAFFGTQINYLIGVILFSCVVSAIEFMAGVCLVTGCSMKNASRLALLLMTVMTPLTLYIALTNPVSDCGCFGDALVLTNWQTFGKNVVLLAAAICVYRYRQHVNCFFPHKLEWLVSTSSAIVSLGLSYYCFNHLPIIDFRPYKVGVNITKAMEYPEGAKQPVFESRFLLEKNGERREFTLDNYPDSTWKWIESRTVLLEKGYEPPIQDFMLQRATDGEDITDIILNDDRYTFLLISPRIELADIGNIHLINQLYDYCVQNGYLFYGVTASTREQIDEWCDYTGAEYPFCQMDEITLKTIVRSHPGLVLLKHGTIIGKWSNRDIPNEEQLTAPLEQLPFGKLTKTSD